jgi:hypothetical protein
MPAVYIKERSFFALAGRRLRRRRHCRRKSERNQVNSSFKPSDASSADIFKIESIPETQDFSWSEIAINEDVFTDLQRTSLHLDLLLYGSELASFGD